MISWEWLNGNSALVQYHRSPCVLPCWIPMVWASCWETQAEILLNEALHSQTQNNLQHTDKNNDPFAVVKLETIPWMLTNTKKLFLQMRESEPRKHSGWRPRNGTPLSLFTNYKIMKFSSKVVKPQLQMPLRWHIKQYTGMTAALGSILGWAGISAYLIHQERLFSP